MPQVLPEGTEGPRLRAGPGGVSGNAVTSISRSFPRGGSLPPWRSVRRLHRPLLTPRLRISSSFRWAPKSRRRAQAHQHSRVRTAGDLMVFGVRKLRYG